jgi:hypothetical protein
VSAFTKKPVTVEAVRLRAGEIPGDTFIHEGIVAGTMAFREDSSCLVQTNHGAVIAQPGEWIIRQVTGELYPCNDEIFQATYTVASRSADSSGDPALSRNEADAIVEKSTAPRVTLDAIKVKIGKAEYFRSGVLTICIITMRNGFTFVGKSACASPENYDQAAGERYAYDDAVRQIWAFEAYLLRETLSAVASSLRDQGGAIEAPHTSQDLRSRGEPRLKPVA